MFFKNCQFVFIGKFKGHRHKNLKELAEEYGGSSVVNCSGNTNFVVIPDDLGSGEKYQSNQQIKIAKKKRKPIVHFKYFRDCLEKKTLLPVEDYLVEEFKDFYLADQEDYGNGNYAIPYQTYFDSSEPYLNLLTSKRSKDWKHWKEYTHTDGRKYYYNIVTGLTQWEKPSDFENNSVRTEEELNQQEVLMEQYRQMMNNFQVQQQMRQSPSDRQHYSEISLLENQIETPNNEQRRIKEEFQEGNMEKIEDSEDLRVSEPILDVSSLKREREGNGDFDRLSKKRLLNKDPNNGEF